MGNNEAVLQKVYSDNLKGLTRDILVSGKVLQENGWQGSLPTVVFTKFDGFWVRLDRSNGLFKVVKVEPWMLEKKKQSIDPNAPLPLSGSPKLNLREMYKNQIKDVEKRS